MISIFIGIIIGIAIGMPIGAKIVRHYIGSHLENLSEMKEIALKEGK